MANLLDLIKLLRLKICGCSHNVLKNGTNQIAVGCGLMIDDLVSHKSVACGEMKKRDYEINENNEANEKFVTFRLLRYFRLFRNPSSSFHHPQNPMSPGIFRSLIRFFRQRSHKVQSYFG